MMEFFVKIGTLRHIQAYFHNNKIIVITTITFFFTLILKTFQWKQVLWQKKSYPTEYFCIEINSFFLMFPFYIEEMKI